MSPFLTDSLSQVKTKVNLKNILLGFGISYEP